MNNTLIFLSAFAFILYGTLCLSTNHMKAEFNRYGLERFRSLTGVLELLGGIGLLAGFYYRPVMLVSASGLAILMLMGTFVRIKSKDSFVEIIPAFSLMLINFYIFLENFKI